MYGGVFHFVSFASAGFCSVLKDGSNIPLQLKYLYFSTLNCREFSDVFVIFPQLLEACCQLTYLHQGQE